MLSICYQNGFSKVEKPVFMRIYRLSYPLFTYSNSMVAGGLPVQS